MIVFIPACFTDPIWSARNCDVMKIWSVTRVSVGFAGGFGRLRYNPNTLTPRVTKNVTANNERFLISGTSNCRSLRRVEALRLRNYLTDSKCALLVRDLEGDRSLCVVNFDLRDVAFSARSVGDKVWDNREKSPSFSDFAFEPDVAIYFDMVLFPIGETKDEAVHRVFPHFGIRVLPEPSGCCELQPKPEIVVF